MLLRVGYEMAFSLPQPTAMVLILHVHPSRTGVCRDFTHLESFKVWTDDVSDAALELERAHPGACVYFCGDSREC